MEKYLYFDLDGTLYNLYKVPNWLERLRANDATVYNEPGYERKSLERIREVVRALKAQGWEIGVISWASKDVCSYNSAYAEIKKAKEEWCAKYFPEVEDNICISLYGEPKIQYISAGYKGIYILIDDNKLVRADWRKAGPNFYTINASRGFVKELQGLLG